MLAKSTSIERMEEDDEPGVDSESGVTSLRYIDYICGHVAMEPIIREVEKVLGIRIDMIEAPGDISGPRYELLVV